MTITLNYGVVFGKCDASDVFEWEVELDEKQEALYKRALMTGESFEDIPELQALCDEAYEDIEANELDGLRDFDDEFTRECLGEDPVDPEEINDLVHAKDAHAIEFFQLGDLSDEELEEWDANDLDDLPMVCEFDEEFEAQSPFECGWQLNVWLPENDDDIPDEQVDAYLKEALAAGDVELAEAIIDGRAYCYSDDIRKTALRIAAEVGCREYIESHKDGPADEAAE